VFRRIHSLAVFIFGINEIGKFVTAQIIIRLFRVYVSVCVISYTIASLSFGVDFLT